MVAGAQMNLQVPSRLYASLGCRDGAAGSGGRTVSTLLLTSRFASPT